MRLVFKKKIRQKYVTSKVRKDVLDLFSQVKLYTYYIERDEIEQKRNNDGIRSNRVSRPTERHTDKIEQMKNTVKLFHRRIRKLKRQMNKDEIKILQDFFIKGEEDIDVMESLGIQKTKYYELKGYVYFLLAVEFNIIDTDYIEISDKVKILG